MKPVNKIKIQWSPAFAYAIGLLTTDGSLSIDRRHINFTSKDLVLVELFRDCLGLLNKLGLKSRGYTKEKKYFQVQFGDVNFYRFLMSIGLTPHKSKTLSVIAIPTNYFFHFLRGHFDGDGTFYSYWDPRWRSSFMYYTVFISASLKHIEWLRSELDQRLNVRGHITKSSKKICYQLKYAKADSIKILHQMYKNKGIHFLERKYLKIKQALAIMNQSF